MNIGDIVIQKPTIYAQCGFEDVEAVPCRVVFVHPEGRFYTVEFQGEHYTWRECFFMRRASESDAPEQRKPQGRHGPQFFRRKQA